MRNRARQLLNYAMRRAGVRYANRTGLGQRANSNARSGSSGGTGR